MTIKKTKHSFENAHSKRRNVCVFLLLCVVLLSAFAIPSHADTTTAEIDYNLFNGWNFCPQADWTLAEGFDGVVEVLDYGILYRTTYASESTIDFLSFSLSNIAPYAKSGYEYTFRVTHRDPGVDIIIGGEVVNNQDDFVLTSANLNAPIEFRRPVDATQVGVSVDVYIRFQFFCRSEEQAGGVDRLLDIDTPFSVTEDFVSRVNTFFNSSVQDAYNAGYVSGKDDVIASFKDRTFLLTTDNLDIIIYAINTRTGDYELSMYPTPLNLQTNWIKFDEMGSGLLAPLDTTFNQYSFIRFNADVWENPFYWSEHDLYVKNDNGVTRVIIEDTEGGQLFFADLPATTGSYVNAIDAVNEIASNELYDKQIGRIALLFYGSVESDFKPDATGGFYFINKDDPYYDDVFSAGEQKGYQDGLLKGEQEGYDNGYRDTKYDYETNIIPAIKETEYKNGYDLGKSNGYMQGLADGENGSNLLYAVITAPVDSAVNVVRSFLNFEILGVNVAGLCGGLLTLALVFAVLKYFI